MRKRNLCLNVFNFKHDLKTINPCQGAPKEILSVNTGFLTGQAPLLPLFPEKLSSSTFKQSR